MMNIYDLSQKTSDRELTDILFERGTTRIERIVSSGETSDWYDQDEDEWVLLIEGEATLETVTPSGSEIVTLYRGDSLFLPANVKHRVTQTSAKPACIWLCVFGTFQTPKNTPAEAGASLSV